MIPNNEDLQNELRGSIYDILDFPKKGIVFKDINPLLRNPMLMKKVIRHMADCARSLEVKHIVGVESRGFFFGLPLALELNLPFVAARKKGKLPGDVVSAAYALEYGTDSIEIQKGALKQGERYFIVDDVIATGGTASATAQIIQEAKAEVSAFCFLIELGLAAPFLQGKKNLAQLYPSAQIFSLLSY